MFGAESFTAELQSLRASSWICPPSQHRGAVLYMSCMLLTSKYISRQRKRKVYAFQQTNMSWLSIENTLCDMMKDRLELAWASEIIPGAS